MPRRACSIPSGRTSSFRGTKGVDSKRGCPCNPLVTQKKIEQNKTKIQRKRKKEKGGGRECGKHAGHDSVLNLPLHPPPVGLLKPAVCGHSLASGQSCTTRQRGLEDTTCSSGTSSRKTHPPPKAPGQENRIPRPGGSTRRCQSLPHPPWGRGHWEPES